MTQDTLKAMIAAALCTKCGAAIGDHPHKVTGTKDGKPVVEHTLCSGYDPAEDADSELVAGYVDPADKYIRVSPTHIESPGTREMETGHIMVTRAYAQQAAERGIHYPPDWVEGGSALTDLILKWRAEADLMVANSPIRVALKGCAKQLEDAIEANRPPRRPTLQDRRILHDLTPCPACDEPLYHAEDCPIWKTAWEEESR